MICATFMASNLLALTIPNGSTVTLSNINMVEDVIVENGGTLIISGGVTFGHPSNTTIYKILVKNFGEVYSTGGSCTGLLVGGQQREWQGFVVMPTTSASPCLTAALHLHNFTIENALTAIELPGTEPSLKGQKISRKKYTDNLWATAPIFEVVQPTTIRKGALRDTDTHSLILSYKSPRMPNAECLTAQRRWRPWPRCP